jgi:hypothetical protein
MKIRYIFCILLGAILPSCTIQHDGTSFSIDKEVIPMIQIIADK